MICFVESLLKTSFEKTQNPKSKKKPHIFLSMNLRIYT